MLPNYNDDPKAHARDNKLDHRLKNYTIHASGMFIYPFYFEDQNCRNGTDVGMFFFKYTFRLGHNVYFFED